MKKLTALLLVLMISVSVCAGWSESDGSAAGQTARKLEGPGYDTPEEAVLAYLDGLNHGDVTEMLATFAYESYAEAAESENYIRRMESINPTMYYAIPVNGDYSRSILANSRYANMAISLTRQYIELAVHLDGMYRQVRDEAEMQEALQDFEQAAPNQWQGHVEFVGWVSPAYLDKFLNPLNRANMALSNSYMMAEDYTVLGAHVRLNGEDAIQTMGCARYHGRWYNMDMQNMITMILGIDLSLNTGIIFSQAGLNLAGASAFQPGTEAAAQLKTWEGSELPGTRWQLVSLEQSPVDGIRVAENPEGIREDPDMSIWAEIRFYRLGSMLFDIHYSLAMDEILQTTEKLCTYMGGAWTEENGIPVLEMVRGNGKKATIDMTDVTCETGDNTLTLVWPWGLRAVFRKAAD